jgi:uncharacterized membrane protein
VLAAATGLYVAAFAWLSIRRYETYNATGLDLAIYTQAIWNTAHGRWFESSVTEANLLGDHADFLLLAYAPLFRLWPDVRSLLLAQTVILALGVIPVTGLALRRLKQPWLAVLLGLLYLLYPSLGFINRYDFHPEVLALPLLLFSLYFIDQERWAPAALMLGLAALSKEYMGVIVAGYGVWILRRAPATAQMRRLGWACLAAGPALTAILIFWFMPNFTNGLNDNFAQRYLWLFGQHVPDAAHLKFLAYTKAIFPLEILAPLGFLPLLAPVDLIPILPPLGIALLSSTPTQTTPYFQYMVEFIPPLFAATIGALERIINQPRAPHLPARPARLGLKLGLLLLSTTGLSWFIHNPFTYDVPPAYFAVSGPRQRDNAPAIEAALRRLPPDACVIASQHLAPQLSQRRQLYILEPLGYDWPPPADCAMAVVDLRERRWGDPLPALSELIGRRGYRVIFRQDDVLVLVAPHPAWHPGLRRAPNAAEGAGRPPERTAGSYCGLPPKPEPGPLICGRF